MELIITLVVWFLLCLLVGSWAGKKGHSVVGYFFLAFFLSPLIGLIVVAILDTDSKSIESEQLQHRQAKRCPHCAEIIKMDARVCKHCGRDVMTAGDVIACPLCNAKILAASVRPGKNTCPACKKTFNATE